MSWVELKVRGLREEADGILGIELAPLAGTLPFTWQAGAHVDVQVEGGQVRQYSLINRPEEGCVRLAVKHAEDSRGGSRWLHRQVRLGDRLKVGTPRNVFPLKAGTGEVVLVAAGIGITPLLAMYRECQRQSRPVRLWYFVREAAQWAFVEQWRNDAAVSLISGLPSSAVIDRLRGELPAWQTDAQLYTCGPEGFMAAVLGLAGERGWPAETLHQEHFQAPKAASDPLPAGQQLVLARSGKTVELRAGESLVAAAERVGVSIATSCGMGMCGACMTPVLGGDIEHRDQYLSEAEQGSGQWIMPCVSACRRGTLTLDL